MCTFFKTRCYFKHLTLSFGSGGVLLYAGSGPSQMNKAMADLRLILLSFRVSE